MIRWIKAIGLIAVIIQAYNFIQRVEESVSTKLYDQQALEDLKCKETFKKVYRK